MVNYRDPAVQAADLDAFIRFTHAMYGLYLWEYFSTLWFEWSFITGKRPYRWTIWVYVGIRLATLLCVVINLIGFNMNGINCQLWIHSEYLTAYTAFALGSFFMILRIIAIWGAHKWVLAVSIVAWLTNIAFMIRNRSTHYFVVEHTQTSLYCTGFIITSAYWEPTIPTCVFRDSRKILANTTATFCTEFFLLLVMIIGLVRQRDHSIGRRLFHQGLVWLLVATVAEVPPFVFLFLNLNDAWNVMFLLPGTIVMTICVTRMHRGLNAIRDHQSASEIPNTTLGFRAPAKVAIPPGSTYSSDRGIEPQTAVRVAMSSHAWQPSDKSDGTPWESTSTTVAGFQGATAI
ncbi:hypothetical protein BJV78DRAFT_342330 [Lactifluus subvellereus]|nr:hypothetical protein BJV78DRAFT_342330 [Lactifluus subvellereus]